MKQTFLVALAVSLAALATAQEAARPPKIGVIDMGKVSSESLLGKTYAGQLDALKAEIDNEGNKKQAELNKMDAAIKALQDELDKQKGVISDEAAERKRLEITKKTRERQAYLEDGQGELQRMRERAQSQAQALNGEFQQKVKPVIEAVAKEKGYDILLDSSVAFMVNTAYDISADVIAKSDVMEKANPTKPTAGAGAASAEKPGPKGASPRPAAKPTPAPSPKK